MDAKLLKKLADTCRKAGIKQYKCAEFEFTLTDEAPISNYKKRNKNKPTTNDGRDALSEYQTDELTQDQLLMWSAGDIPEGAET